MGPTAAGKTAAALQLLKQFPFEIISVDSALVYRGLDIGTAKPDPATLGWAPHHLVDVANPDEAYSAGRFRADATAAIRKIRGAGRIPLLVGGTGLYFRTLTAGLAEMPAANAQIRAQIDAEADRIGWPQMHCHLAGIDPAAAARIHPNDAQRIQRAIEVFRVSGKPISHWQRRRGHYGVADTVYRVAWAPPRTVLHENIKKRFKYMIDNGFIEEVTSLFKTGQLHRDLPAMRAVGYRQLWRYCSGEVSLEQSLADAETATRRLARRQLTWLRAEPGLVWLDPGAVSASKRLNQVAARVVQSCRY